MHEGGQLEWKEIEITIDGSEPELDVVADEFAIPGVRFRLEVDPHEPVRELYAYLPGVAQAPHAARARQGHRALHGRPAHPRATSRPTRSRSAIVARDRARNRVDQDVRVPVLSDLDCCDDDEESETCYNAQPGGGGGGGAGSVAGAGGGATGPGAGAAAGGGMVPGTTGT